MCIIYFCRTLSYGKNSVTRFYAFKKQTSRIKVKHHSIKIRDLICRDIYISPSMYENKIPSRLTRISLALPEIMRVRACASALKCEQSLKVKDKSEKECLLPLYLNRSPSVYASYIFLCTNRLSEKITRRNLFRVNIYYPSTIDVVGAYSTHVYASSCSHYEKGGEYVYHIPPAFLIDAGIQCDAVSSARQADEFWTRRETKAGVYDSYQTYA